MSNITSSNYPVITVSKAGDQFVIVQGGQVKKLTRSGLEALIDELTPNTIIELTDVPGSYVGQQGKVLVVNPTEDGMVFESATSGNFLSLSDTPSTYAAQAGKLPIVNSGETALEFIDNAFIDLGDTPVSYAGQAKNIARVNVAENAMEFVTPTVAAPAANSTGGFFDYNHGGGTQAYTGGSGFVKLLNDETGAFTNKTYAPPGVSDVWDEVANEFDWTELSLGDEVGIRLDVSFTTVSVNQSVDVDLFLAVGSGSDYQIKFRYNEYKTAGTYPVQIFNKIYMGDNETLNFPAEFRLKSDGNATIQVNGWYCSINKRGAV